MSATSEKENWSVGAGGWVIRRAKRSKAVHLYNLGC